MSVFKPAEVNLKPVPRPDFTQLFVRVIPLFALFVKLDNSIARVLTKKPWMTLLEIELIIPAPLFKSFKLITE